MAMYRIFNLPILKLCQRNREAVVYKFDYFFVPCSNAFNVWVPINLSTTQKWC